MSDDGGVPVYFQTSSGNVADDQTHQATWKLMAELVKRPDFVYVADCKLATTANMSTATGRSRSSDEGHEVSSPRRITF